MHVVHQARPVVPRDRLIRLTEVERLAGVKKSTLYSMLKAGLFPKPIRLSARCSVWSEVAVLEWVQERVRGVPVSAVATIEGQP